MNLTSLYAHLLFIYKRPENNYYFPDLHHMRYEIEDGTTPSGRALRFGFDPLEFPGFSWRGYAQMTPVQVSSQGDPPQGRAAQAFAHSSLSGSPKRWTLPKTDSSILVLRSMDGARAKVGFYIKRIYRFHSLLLL